MCYLAGYQASPGLDNGNLWLKEQTTYEHRQNATSVLIICPDF